MKLTKSQLKQIIREELDKLKHRWAHHEADFNDRKVQVTRIHDGFVDFLESQNLFPIGEIPKSVMDAIMQAALKATDALEWRSALDEGGFGEGTPSDNEWGKKRVIALEEEEEAKDNPWASCTASVGRDDKEKYESCVQSVKKEKGIN